MQRCNTNLQRSEVNDVVDVWVLLKHLFEGGFILDVGLVEVWPLAADELDTIQDLLRGVVKVIDNDDLVAGIEKSKGCERANVASATGSN